MALHRLYHIPDCIPSFCAASLRCTALVIGMLCLPPSHADERLPVIPASEESVFQAAQGETWVPLADQRLAVLRGGFDSGAGLVVSFGIERAVYIDGNLVTTTAFNVGALGSATAQAGPSISISTGAAGTVSVVQNGQANLVQTTTAAGAALPETFIQNTLNGQTINTTTIINATANSLSALKTLNLNATLLNAVNAAAGGGGH